ncbi:MAG: RNA-binding transcriptional accessory protein [Opitutales bacterium]|nr:RNA-binding transcriptional accessory protein [Opitutales bacterium]
MNTDNISKIAKELSLPISGVAATAKLISEGATVPFIARYRKEATGSLDEVAITAIRDAMERLAALDERRGAVKKSLEERNLLTPEISAALDAAETLARVEDIYQPFRPKRRTRATIARERGLEPLANYILENQNGACAENAAEFVSAEKEVPDAAAALAGARDIIAESMADSPEAREAVRGYFEREAQMSSKAMFGKEAEGAKYRDYFDWSEKASAAPSHRVLAVRRGEAEGFLIMRITPKDSSGAVSLLKKMFVNGSGECASQVAEAADDAYSRLLSATSETHMRLEVKKRADEEAVKIFAGNLRELLMAAPLGRKSVLAIDPGFRTGCKVVCLDAQGKLLHNDVIYPEQGEFKAREAALKIRDFCSRFGIEAIAIGNGTAGRETEAFVRSLSLTQPVVMVNESGASIYSASEAAREEFPDRDITVRGAVSIGRRLMDPLAELVKIDPQSIGVGQYQHDVNQTLLKRSLDDTVISCVNSVGVEVNTASKQLLSYVSGLNASVAANIVEHRNANGAFKSRRDLLKVKGLGAKTFEQAAGFLRIRGGDNPLDASAVHPERYAVVEKMASDIGCDVQTLMRDPSARAKIDLKKYEGEGLGMPTLKDIMQELGKPGRDPREQFEAFSFAEGVNKIEDLREGMRLPGIVTNVTAFGAFVDIGVHQDGLVHISELSDRFVKDPAEVVKPQQKVSVFVLEVDAARKRISLSMKSAPQKRAKSAGEAAKYSSPKTPNPRRSSPQKPFGNSFGDALSGLKF